MSDHLAKINDWPERAEQANWSAAMLAKKCGVSLRTLERHFTEEFSKTVRCWLSEERMRKGKELTEKDWKIREIAMKLGYRHVQHFSRAYKQFFGCCPTQMWTVTKPIITEVHITPTIAFMENVGSVKTVERI